MLTKRARDMGILGNKVSSEESFRGEGKFLMPTIICKPAFALWNNAIFEGKALIKIVGERCFVDYQLTGIGILSSKGSSEDSV